MTAEVNSRIAAMAWKTWVLLYNDGPQMVGSAEEKAEHNRCPSESIAEVAGARGQGGNQAREAGLPNSITQGFGLALTARLSHSFLNLCVQRFDVQKTFT
jgi:hypothetical protein